MGFRALRVINEDWIQPGQGFGDHPHRDMEIVTYPLEGELQHRDSLGNGSVIRPGEVQRMSAGTGVVHSEFNPSPRTKTHLLQIWILPEKKGARPEYEQKNFPEKDAQGRLRLLASPTGQDGSVTVHQDVRLYDALLAAGQSVRHPLPGRYGWLQVISGELSVNGTRLAAGDAAALSGESELTAAALGPSKLLLFDLA
jgi:quercetin 2,3-dioxygenase